MLEEDHMGNYDTYILLLPSGITTDPMLALEVRKIAQVFLKNKTLPKMYRALDVLQAIGFKIFTQENDPWNPTSIRLPKHLMERHIYLKK